MHLCGHSAILAACLRAQADHYVIPSAPTLVRSLELFELSDWADIIVLQSVLDEVACPARSAACFLTLVLVRSGLQFNRDASGSAYNAFK